MAKPAQAPSLTTTNTFFTQESVKRLRETDFTVGSKELIALNYDDCILILFYNENTESKHVAELWAKTAAQVAGPIFAACNLITEKKVAEAFTRLGLDSNHPLRWAALKQTPFILVYRRGWPQAFYNGDRTVEAFADYALTLACTAEYEEHKQKYAGIQMEERLEITHPKVPTAPRTSSEEFKGTTPLRGYDTRFAPVIVGSPEEKAEIETILKERAAAGTPPRTPQPGVSTPQPGAVTPAPTPAPSGGIPIGVNRPAPTPVT